MDSFYANLFSRCVISGALFAVFGEYDYFFFYKTLVSLNNIEKFVFVNETQLVIVRYKRYL